MKLDSIKKIKRTYLNSNNHFNPQKKRLNNNKCTQKLNFNNKSINFRFYSRYIQPKFSIRTKDKLSDPNEISPMAKEALKQVDQDRERFLEFLETNKNLRGPIREFFNPSHCSSKNCCRKWGSTRSTCVITGEKVRSDPAPITRIFEKDPEDYYVPRTIITISAILFIIINIRYIILWFHDNHPNQVKRREIDARLKRSFEKKNQEEKLMKQNESSEN